MSSTKVIASDQAPLAGGHKFWWLIAGASLLSIVVWSLIPWQWSPVDDPGQAQIMRQLIDSQGALGSFFQRASELAIGDKEGGVFRPLAWVYPPLIYSLPVTPAHIVRLVMVLILIIGPLVYFRRQGASASRLWMTALLLVASASVLYQGLLLLSIQELGGMALVSAGLWVRGRPGRLALWTAAAWFKGPFAWVLIGYSVVLWREGRRRWAVASASIGLLTLAINFWWSRQGTYTGRYRIDPFDPQLYANALKIFELSNAVLVVAVLWWVAATGTRLVPRRDLAFFAIATGGYTAQMIPWGFTAYYMGPITFLIGLLLASMLADPEDLSRRRLSLALGIPFLIAVGSAYAALSFVVRTNDVMWGTRECLTPLQGTSSIVFGDWLYITSSEEGPLRIEQNVRFFSPDWEGTVSPVSNDTASLAQPSTTHAISLMNSPLPEGRSATKVCTAGPVVLYQLS